MIGPRSHELQAGLAEARDIDEVLRLHEHFMDSCLKECLLASQEHLKILTKLMTTCLHFADQMTRFAMGHEGVTNGSDGGDVLGGGGKGKGKSFPSVYRSGSDGRQEREQQLEEQARVIERETSHETFSRMLDKVSSTFDEQLREFLSNLWSTSYQHHVQLVNLCVRLDYNGYYSQKFSGSG